MPAIAEIGAVLEVAPQEEVWIMRGVGVMDQVRDFSPFRMQVQGAFEECGVVVGVYGPVIGGAPRYHGLTANLFVRLDGSDWRRDGETQANFKVGPARARRVAGYDFRDPRGTEIDGLPVIGRFGRVRVLPADT